MNKDTQIKLKKNHNNFKIFYSIYVVPMLFGITLYYVLKTNTMVNTSILLFIL